MSMTEGQGAVLRSIPAAEPAEYEAVRERAGLVDRSDLAVVELSGRDPARMVHGLITGDLLAAGPDRAVYGAMLTPKGRSIAELRALRRPSEGGERVILVLPREVAAAATAHLTRSVPPLYARWKDVTSEVVALGVYGPGSAGVLTAAADRLGGEGLLEAAAEDAVFDLTVGGQAVVAIATRYAGGEHGFDLLMAADAAPAVQEALTATGVSAVGAETLEVLRVEGGVPRGGHELTEEVIPTEAFEAIGMMERAISFQKGCYTGQEVIVRIAHRGHVNRHLRGLVLDRSAPAPAPGARLFDPARERDVGWVTSVVVSPRMGGPVALGYVRREMEPGAEVRVGGVEGPAATVSALPFGADPAEDR